MSDFPAGPPPRVAVTPDFLAEQEARQRAYVAGRLHYMAAFEPKAADTPEAPRASGSLNLATRSRSRKRREDPRQLSFDV